MSAIKSCLLHTKQAVCDFFFHSSLCNTYVDFNILVSTTLFLF